MHSGHRDVLREIAEECEKVLHVSFERQTTHAQTVLRLAARDELLGEDHAVGGSGEAGEGGEVRDDGHGSYCWVVSD